MPHGVALHVWHACGIVVNRNQRHWCGMSRDDLHFRLRIPEELKARVEAAAEKNRRSMTAEIIERLEASLGPANASYEVQPARERVRRAVEELKAAWDELEIAEMVE